MHTLMLLLLKKNIFQLRCCIKENDSISIKLSASNPLRILWQMAHLRWSVDWWVWPVATSMRRCCFPLTPGVTVKSINLLHTIRTSMNLPTFWQYHFLKLANKIQQMLPQMTPPDEHYICNLSHMIV